MRFPQAGSAVHTILAGETNVRGMIRRPLLVLIVSNDPGRGKRKVTNAKYRVSLIMLRSLLYEPLGCALT